MAAQTPKAPNKSGAGPKPPTTKKPALNRAQIKAMEARAASAARAAAFARGEDVEEMPAASGVQRVNRPARRSGVRAGAERGAGFSPAAPELSVRAEMDYQRRDLMRLLLLTGILLVAYILLWFFLR